MLVYPPARKRESTLPIPQLTHSWTAVHNISCAGIRWSHSIEMNTQYSLCFGIRWSHSIEMSTLYFVRWNQVNTQYWMDTQHFVRWNQVIKIIWVHSLEHTKYVKAAFGALTSPNQVQWGTVYFCLKLWSQASAGIPDYKPASKLLGQRGKGRETCVYTTPHIRI
jgi:hypothetical protein